MSPTRAGLSSERTISVSSRTPKATMNANCTMNISGITASAAKMTSSATTVEVATPPVMSPS